MLSSAIFGLSLLAAFTPFAQAEHGNARRHNAIAHRARGDVELHKRFDNARFTYYAVGLGACGQTNVESDFIVALNSDQYGGGYPGPSCFKSITITANGKTTTATIMDECPGCPYGGLDFSQGLFEYFADTSVGVLYGTWYYNDGSSGGGGGDKTTTSTKKTSWTPTSTWTPWTPTSTWSWTPPTTTSSKKKTSTSSTWTPSSTSTWSSSSSSSSWSSTSSTYSSSSSSTSHSSSSTSSSVAATPTVSSTKSDPENLNGLNQLLAGIGGLIIAGQA